MNDVDDFLFQPRIGIFSTAIEAAWARPVPVWFDWTDGRVQLFSAANAPKIQQLSVTPRAHLLATNAVGEPERWVSIAGSVALGAVDGRWLEALTGRYWDLSTAEPAATLRGWLDHLDRLVSITITPEEVRHYGF